MIYYFLLVIMIFCAIIIGIIYYFQRNNRYLEETKALLLQSINSFKQDVKDELLQKQNLEQQRHIEDLQRLQNTIRDSFSSHKEELQNNINQLNSNSMQNLRSMHLDLDTKLQQSFLKNQNIFVDITNRLTLIDNAQKNLHELTNNIVSLQKILADKRSRGAFGETQLKHLVENMIPSEYISWQHSLSSGVRCDCLLKLPQPTGHIVIDAKFPLENYQKMLDVDNANKQFFMQAFKNDIKTHLQDIAKKYIINGETAACALMFVPAEAIFAEIYGQFPELVALANSLRVWIVSPTTLMAILTTVSSVLQDILTQKHVNIIKQHIQVLSQDFQRFDLRWQKLLKHLELTHIDANEINTSVKKITVKFNRIETADVESFVTE